MNVKTLCLSALLLSTLSSISLQSESSLYDAQKIYIEENDIALNDDCMFLQLEDGTFATTALREDADGYFVYASDLIVSKSKADYYCGDCQDYKFTQRTYDSHRCKGKKDRHDR